MNMDQRRRITPQVVHVHDSSSAALTNFFTSAGASAILSITSDKCRLNHAWDISADQSAWQLESHDLTALRFTVPMGVMGTDEVPASREISARLGGSVRWIATPELQRAINDLLKFRTQDLLYVF